MHGSLNVKFRMFKIINLVGRYHRATLACEASVMGSKRYIS